jgi:hypothetical protein
MEYFIRDLGPKKAVTPEKRNKMIIRRKFRSGSQEFIFRGYRKRWALSSCIIELNKKNDRALPIKEF